jgi:hypothetical protein
VDERREQWEDAHRAWDRLAGWFGGGRDNATESAGDDALDALADIGTLRRLLDQAELAAVRAARRHRKSWAEIATQLGITRQSAWERWRELDEDAPASTSAEHPEDRPGNLFGDIAHELVGELTLREARASRRRSKVVVPNVVGMSYDDARHALLRAGLAPSTDPDAPPLAALGWPNVVVVDQAPEAGAKVPARTQVMLWVERGGGSAGVREPRRPDPSPKSGYEWRDEPSGEAVG